MSTYKSLDDINIIRKRPDHFIGSVETPLHLLTEIIDNSLDEISNDFANIFSINFDENGAYWVSDNGRGFEIYDMTLHDGTVEDSIVSLCTKQHTGSKFDVDDYSKLIGMHGVGLVCVNSLSDWLVINTFNRNDKILYKYTFLDSVLSSKEKIDDIKFDGLWTTCVGFYPSKKYFNSIEFSKESIIQRLLLVQSKYNCDIYINNKQLPKLSYDNFVKDILNIKDNNTNLYNFSYKYDGNDIKYINSKINISIIYNNDPNMICYGDVNLKLCEGTYITSFLTLLKNKILNKMSDLNLKDFNQSLLFHGLKLYISLEIAEPTYGGQSKEKMTLNVKSQLIDPLENFIDKFLKETNAIEIIKNNIITKLSKPKTKNYTKRASKENKLIDSTIIPGDILYILEGDSALGTLQKIISLKRNGIFPLGGKFINVYKNTIEKILKNTAFQHFKEAIGEKDSRRYNEIGIVADADFDGYHIIALATMMIQYNCYDMILNGKTSIYLPPLYGITKNINGKKIFIPAYTEKQKQELSDKNSVVKRFKGLGEMNADELKECIINKPMKYVLKPPTDNELIALKKLITNSDIKKELIKKTDLNLISILNKINK